MISNSRKCAASCRCRSSLFLCTSQSLYKPKRGVKAVAASNGQTRRGSTGRSRLTLFCGVVSPRSREGRLRTQTRCPRWAHGWCEDPPGATDSHAGAWPASSAAVSPVRGAGGTGHPPPAATPQRWRTRRSGVKPQDVGGPNLGPRSACEPVRTLNNPAQRMRDGRLFCTGAHARASTLYPVCVAPLRRWCGRRQLKQCR